MKRYRPTSYLNDRLLKSLRSAAVVRVQNGLMRSSDREIALAFGRMEPEDVERILEGLPAAKEHRIREELSYHKRLRITEEQYERMVEKIIAAVTGGRARAPSRSYIRPGKASGRRR